MEKKRGLGLLVERHQIAVVLASQLVGKNDQVLALELSYDRIFVLVGLKIRQVQVCSQLVAQVLGHLDSHLVINVGNSLVDAGGALSRANAAIVSNTVS